MKLWQASERGRELSRASRGLYVDFSTPVCKACEIGTILLGVNGQQGVKDRLENHQGIFKQLDDAFPELSQKEIAYPKGSRCAGELGSLDMVLEDLFEGDHWSRERIEKWLKELDL